MSHLAPTELRKIFMRTTTHHIPDTHADLYPQGSYEVVSGKNAIAKVIGEAVKASQSDSAWDWVALDFETTGLYAELGQQVRLCQLQIGERIVVLDFGFEAGLFAELADKFQGGNFVVFNAGFEMTWWLALDITPPNLWDSALLHKSIHGGSSINLKGCLAEIGVELDKSEQDSAWGNRQLTKEQYDYAALDAVVTTKLWHNLLGLTDEGIWSCFNMLNKLVEPCIEMRWSGLLLEKDRHKALCEKWRQIKASKQATMNELLLDAETGALPIANYNSAKQWSDYFKSILPHKILREWPKTEKTAALGMRGTLSMANNVIKNYAALWGDNPLGQVLYAYQDYRKVSTYLSSFGETLITKAELSHDGRIHPNYNIAFAVTRRFSSSQPNAQNFPRDAELLGERVSVRDSFIAPEGHKVVSLDYSGIELRVAGLLAGDDNMLYDAIHGDIHSEMGSAMAGRVIDKNNPDDKAIRSAAKSGTFALLYGGGAPGVAANMKMGLDDGANFIEKWKELYPKAYNRRYAVHKQANIDGYIRCWDGGTIHPFKGGDDDYAHLKNDDELFSVPVCANYPVQNAAFMIMAWAIIYFKQGLDYYRANGELTSAKFLATIHDQLIAEASDAEADAVLDVMRQSMIAAFSKTFPDAETTNLVEGGKGQSWGELS